MRSEQQLAPKLAPDHLGDNSYNILIALHGRQDDARQCPQTHATIRAAHHFEHDLVSVFEEFASSTFDERDRVDELEKTASRSYRFAGGCTSGDEIAYVERAAGHGAVEGK